MSIQSGDGEKDRVASVHDLWGNVPLMLSGLRTDYKAGLWQEALLFK